MPFIKIDDPTAVPVANLDVSYKKQNEHLFLLRHFISQSSELDINMIMPSENNDKPSIVVGSIIETGGALYHLREENLNITDDSADGICYIKLVPSDNGNNIQAVLTNEYPQNYNHSLKGYYTEENGKLVKYMQVSMRKSGGLFYDIVKWTPSYDKMGILFLFGGDISKIPKGYLFCDGREMSRAGYKYLFDTIDTDWGEGDGVATFNLPDCRGGVPRGVGSGKLLNPNRNSRFRGITGGNIGDKNGTYESEKQRSYSLHKKGYSGRGQYGILEVEGKYSEPAGSGMVNWYDRTVYRYELTSNKLNTVIGNFAVNYIIKY